MQLEFSGLKLVDTPAKTKVTRARKARPPAESDGGAGPSAGSPSAHAQLAAASEDDAVEHATRKRVRADKAAATRPPFASRSTARNCRRSSTSSCMSAFLAPPLCARGLLASDMAQGCQEQRVAKSWAVCCFRSLSLSGTNEMATLFLAACEHATDINESPIAPASSTSTSPSATGRS